MSDTESAEALFKQGDSSYRSDPKSAVDFWRKAAELGHAEAMVKTLHRHPNFLFLFFSKCVVFR